MFTEDKYYHFRFEWMIPDIDGRTILKRLQTGSRLGLTFLFGGLQRDEDGYWMTSIFVRVRSEDFLKDFVEYVGCQIEMTAWEPVTEFLNGNYSPMISAVPDFIKATDMLGKQNCLRRQQNEQS